MVALINVGERQIRLIELTVFFKKCLLSIIRKGAMKVICGLWWSYVVIVIVVVIGCLETITTITTNDNFYNACLINEIGRLNNFSVIKLKCASSPEIWKIRCLWVIFSPGANNAAGDELSIS